MILAMEAALSFQLERMAKCCVTIMNQCYNNNNNNNNNINNNVNNNNNIKFVTRCEPLLTDMLHGEGVWGVEEVVIRRHLQ